MLFRSADDWRTFQQVYSSIARPDYISKFQSNYAANKAFYHDKYQWIMNIDPYKDMFVKWYQDMNDQYLKKIDVQYLKIKDNINYGLLPMFSRTIFIDNI